MPTTLPRIQITLTPPVEEWLATARQHHNGDAKASELVTELMAKGAEAMRAEDDAARDRRMAALDRLRALNIHYPPNYLEDERKGWIE